MDSGLRSFVKSSTGRYYILALFIYTVAITLFISHNFHGICPDETAYYNIGLKYRSLHFKEALNAYWSPLLSWLLVPLVKTSFFAFREIMLVNFLCGYLLLYLTYKFSRRYSLGTYAEVIFLFSMLLLIICIQLPLFGADFLSATTFLTYIFLITSSRNKEQSSFYLLTALAALLCAFAKSIFIFYILLHLSFLIGYSLWNKKNEPLPYRKNLFKILLVYLLGISVWTGLLSWKYERWMVNSSGAYNLNLMSPQGYLKHYSETSGLIAPPDAYSVIHWVDPTYYPVQKREVFKNSDTLRYQWGILKYNARVALYSFSYFSYFKLLILAFMAFPFFLKKKKEKKELLVYFLSSFFILGAYTLVFIEERYLIGCQLLLFVAVFFSFHCLYQERSIPRSKILYHLLLLVIAVSFCKNCYLQFTTWTSYRKEFSKTLNIENEIRELPFLKNKKLANGPFDHSGLSLDYIAFSTGSQGFGNTNALQTEQEQYLDLKKHQIDYYVHQDHEQDSSQPKKVIPSFLKGKIPVYHTATGSVKIYSLKPYDP